MSRSSGPRAMITLAAAVLAACQGTAAPTTPTAPAASAAGAATSAAATAATTTGTLAPDPTRLEPTTDVPTGYSKGASVPFGFGLVVDGVLLAPNMDDATLTRWDARSFDELGHETLGEKGAFPPDLQSAFPGSEGVWVTLAAQHAVGLLDPRTGEITRTIKVLGQPYDIFEADGELWIADFGWGQISRYDLETDEEVAIIRGVPSPTDVIVAEGSVWAPIHTGRTDADEPISAGGMVARIDPATNKVVSSTKVWPRPYYMTAGFGGIWTGTATGGSVDRVDVATEEVTHIQIGEDGAFDIDVSGDSVWAVVGPQWPVERQCDPTTSFFVRIDPTTRQVSERIAFPCPGSITPAGNGFWVSGWDGKSATSTYFEVAD